MARLKNIKSKKQNVIKTAPLIANGGYSDLLSQKFL